MTFSTFIVDIDQTLANHDHRTVHLEHFCSTCQQVIEKPCGDEGCDMSYTQSSFDQFLKPELILQDTPYEKGIRFITKLLDQGVYVVFLTGRNEGLRSVTEQWLREHLPLPKYMNVLMRPQGDSRPASQVKEGLFLTHVLSRYPGDFVFIDDDLHVLKMFSDYGTVLRAPHCWDVLMPDFPETPEKILCR